MTPESTAAIAVVTVTFNSRPELDDWAAALEALEPSPAEVVIVDNNSSDESAAFLEEWSNQTTLKVRTIRSAENTGFAGGMNRAIALTTAPYVLLLNPDARPTPAFLSCLLEGLDEARSMRPRVGAVAARLVRLEEQPLKSAMAFGQSAANDSHRPRLDACGMHLVSSWRHFDRGTEEVDVGQFEKREWVFGATGAASLFVREALEDTLLDGQIFDEDFHSFREDAELCFRLQERGWSVLYEPHAVCLHRRSNTPKRRPEMSAAVNQHTLKNRYLLRLYHQTPGNILATGIPTLLRDIGIFGYVLLFERSSLGAYSWLWRHRKRILSRRRSIHQRRTVPPAITNRWFFKASEPLEH